MHICSLSKKNFGFGISDKNLNKTLSQDYSFQGQELLWIACSTQDFKGIALNILGTTVHLLYGFLAKSYIRRLIPLSCLCITYAARAGGEGTFK